MHRFIYSHELVLRPIGQPQFFLSFESNYADCSDWRSVSRRSRWSWTNAPLTRNTWRSRITEDRSQWWQFIPLHQLLHRLESYLLGLKHDKCILLVVGYGKDAIYHIYIASFIYFEISYNLLWILSFFVSFPWKGRGVWKSAWLEYFLSPSLDIFITLFKVNCFASQQKAFALNCPFLQYFSAMQKTS